MTNNQQQVPPAEPVQNESAQPQAPNRSKADANKQQGSVFSNIIEAIRAGEFKTLVQRYIFRLSQWSKQPDSLATRYRDWLTHSWEKWLGLGAGVTGLLMLLNPDSFWRWQFVLLIILMLLAPLVFAFFGSLKDFFSAYPGKHFIGEVITLEEPIINGNGSILLQREEWLISGPDCNAGTKVKITAIDDRKLYVALVG